jgi:hypothetical protein
MAMSSRILLIAVGCIALGACDTMNKPIGMDDPGMGEAVRYNAAVQTVNPDPIYPPGAAQPGDSGVKAAAAVKRYRTDTVKQVEAMETTSGSSGSSPR